MEDDEAANGLLSQSGPFGNPDASLSQIDAPVTMKPFPTLSPDAAHLDFNIVVGRKGAGKTFLWKTAAAAATNRVGVFASVETESLGYQTLATLSRALEADRVGGWQRLWRRVVFLHAASLLFAHNPATTLTEEGFRDRFRSPEFFRTQFGELFLRVPVDPLSPVQWLDRLSTLFPLPHDLSRYLTHYLWPEFENFVLKVVPSGSPLLIFIDALDNEADKAPEAWKECQLGLLHCVVDMIRHKQFKKISVVTTVRESVYRSVLTGEHASRLAGDSHIRILKWGRRENDYFFREKIAQVIGRQANDSLDELLLRWLGFNKIRVPRRGIEEPVSEYISRHTRCLPRDMIVMGNAIALEMESCLLSKGHFSEGNLRKAVQSCARLFATESLAICTTEMLMVDGGVSAHDSHENLRAKGQMQSRISVFIKALKEEVFDREALGRALRESGFVTQEDELTSRWRIDNVLWRNGMLAYAADYGTSAETKWIYNWYDVTEDHSRLPEAAHKFGLHPSFIDKFGIEVVKDNLIV